MASSPLSEVESAGSTGCRDAPARHAAGASLAELRRLVPSALLDGPGWDRVMACVAELPDTGPATLLLGYEFRLGEETPAGPRPEPGVFLKIRFAAEHQSHDRLQPLPLAALADAVGWPEDGALRRSVARVLAALPPGGRVRHVGALPGRAPRAVRLVIQEIEHDEVAGVLERWDRRGWVRPAMEVLTDLGEVLPRFRLAVDVAATGLLPRLGLELYHEGSWNDGMDSWLATGRSDWRPVVERLALCGWCLPAKARGLLQWCALDKMYDSQGVFIVYKGINHVKLTVTGAGVAAKAYAGMACSLIQDRQPGSGG